MNRKLLRHWRRFQNPRLFHQLCVAGNLRIRHQKKTKITMQPGMSRVRFSPVALQMMLCTLLPVPLRVKSKKLHLNTFWDSLSQHEFVICGGLYKAFVRVNSGPGPNDFTDVEAEFPIDDDDIERISIYVLLVLIDIESYCTGKLQEPSEWFRRSGQLIKVIFVLLQATLNTASQPKARRFTQDKHPPPEPLKIIPSIQPNAPSA